MPLQENDGTDPMTQPRLKRMAALGAQIVMASLSLAFLLVVVVHFWEEYRFTRALPDIFLRYSAEDFVYRQKKFLRWQDERNLRTSSPSAGSVTITAQWHEYFKAATAFEHSEIHTFSLEQSGEITLFRARPRKGYVMRIVVGMPSEERDLSHYVVLGLIRDESNRSARRMVLAYSPTTPDKLFATPVELDPDIAQILLDTLESHDWSQPFNPPPQQWPSFYPVMDTDIGPCTSRDDHNKDG